MAMAANSGIYGRQQQYQRISIEKYLQTAADSGGWRAGIAAALSISAIENSKAGHISGNYRFSANKQ